MAETDLILRTRHRDSCAMTAYFKKTDLVDERALHRSKWFDYRFMSPREATHLFRTEFQKVYQRKYSANIDTEKSHNKFGVRRGPAEQDRTEFTSFWRARQFADQLGMSYDVFLEAAFEVLLRGSFERMPRINQIYGKHRVRVTGAAIRLWEEHCASRFVYSALPHYREESFCGLAAQTDHQGWVLDQLKSRSNHAIGRACFTLRILSQVRATIAFGEERLERARENVAGEIPAPHEGYELRQLLPSCAMLPGARDASSVECSACNVTSFCTLGEASVLGTVAAVTGVIDPEEHRRRKLGRDRTRKHRREKKLAAEIPLSSGSEDLRAGGI